MARNDRNVCKPGHRFADCSGYRHAARHGNLEPIWTTKTKTAVRLRGRLESVLDWATVRGYRAGLNPARWKGHHSVMLPAPGKVANAERHAALPYVEMPRFMSRLRAILGESAYRFRSRHFGCCVPGLRESPAI
jgi:hypothetical protein